MHKSVQEESNRAREQRDVALLQRNDARHKCSSLKKDNDDLNEHADSAQEFILALTHDIKGPVAVIEMAIGLLTQDLPSERFEKYKEMIESNAVKASELISHLLDANLIKSGKKLPLDLVNCDLISILENCIATIPMEEGHRITLSSENRTQILGVWDGHLLERSFRNLLTNAIKFGGTRKNIQVELSQGPDLTKIVFRNFGETIPLEDLGSIFTLNFQTSDPTNSSHAGWGLGLTVVKGVAKAHNGEVEVSSSVDDGTTFTVTLPSRPAGPWLLNAFASGSIQKK